MTEPMPTPDMKRSHREILVVILVVLVCGVSTIWLPLGRDHGIGLYIADVMLDGGAPYQDAWDIKPPGAFYINALSILIFGNHPLGLRIFDLLWQLATVLALVQLGRRLFGKRAGLWAGIVYPVAYFFGNDFWHLGNFDAFIALPYILALLCLLPQKRGPRLTWDLAGGLFMGFVFLIRYTHGLIFIPALFLLFTARVDVKRSFARVAVVVAGFLCSVALFLLHMWAKDALDIYFFTLLHFAPRYAATTFQSSGWALIKFIASVSFHFVVKYTLLTVPAIIAAVMLARRKSANGWMVVIWCFSVFIGVAIMTKFFAYHWLPLYAPLALLAGVFVDRCVDDWKEIRSVLAITGKTIALVCLVLFIARFGPAVADRYRDAWQLNTGKLSRLEHLEQFDSIAQGGDYSASANYLCADYLQRHTQRQDPVFVWGFEMLIYHLADRRPPTRFCSNFPLTVTWHRQDWYEELAASLEKNKPVYILLATGDVMPWVTGHMMDSVTTLKQKFPELSNMIVQNYTVETQIKNMIVCRLQNL